MKRPIWSTQSIEKASVYWKSHVTPPEISSHDNGGLLNGHVTRNARFRRFKREKLLPTFRYIERRTEGKESKSLVGAWLNSSVLHFRKRLPHFPFYFKRVTWKKISYLLVTFSSRKKVRWTLWMKLRVNGLLRPESNLHITNGQVLDFVLEN